MTKFFGVLEEKYDSSKENSLENLSLNIEVLEFHKKKIGKIHEAIEEALLALGKLEKELNTIKQSLSNKK